MRLHKRAPHDSERETLAAEPEQDEAVAYCLQAWRDLATERPLGFSGAGPIPRSKLIEWASYQGFDREVAAVLWIVICRLERDRNERENSAAALRGA